IEAGAQAVQIFDSWGGSLPFGKYQEFSLQYMARIVAGLKRENDGRKVPVIVFTKGGGQWLEDIAATGCDAIGLDWTTDLGEARRRVGDKVALQGNFDPVALFAPPAAIEVEVERILSSYGGGTGHVFNLGHGISQFTNPDHAAALVAAVHRFSGKK
ncbi:MAG: uroporphyrinogen decarboxylase family protein, partial [Deefgea sp.]